MKHWHEVASFKNSEHNPAATCHYPKVQIWDFYGKVLQRWWKTAAVMHLSLSSLWHSKYLVSKYTFKYLNNIFMFNVGSMEIKGNLIPSTSIYSPSLLTTCHAPLSPGRPGKHKGLKQTGTEFLTELLLTLESTNPKIAKCVICRLCPFKYMLL